MTERQLLLDFPTRNAMTPDAFLPAPSNAMVLAACGRWRDWPELRQVVIGPPGSGRSHLARVWLAEVAGLQALCLSGAALGAADVAAAEAAAAIAVDDADAVAGAAAREEALFHLLNLAARKRIPLLLTSRGTPGTWGLALPDLESRVRACPVARLEPPEPDLVAMVLVKLCDERQLAVSPGAIAYLAHRMERSLATAAAVVERLDRLAVARKARVTRPLAVEALRGVAEAAQPPRAEGPPR